MKRFYFSLVLVTALLVLALGASATLARSGSETPPFDTYESELYPCKYDDSQKKEWMSDDVIHVRNSIGFSFGISEDPQFSVETIENLSWNFNLKKGEGRLWGPYEQKYTSDYGEGYWVGLIEGKIYLNEQGVPLAVGKGVFDGKGLFEGLRMKSTWSQVAIGLDERIEACGFPPELGDPPLVKTEVEHHVIETTGTWPPGE